MEITVGQLQELIFEEEQIKEIAQTQSDRLDYEASGMRSPFNRKSGKRYPGLIALSTLRGALISSGICPL